MEKSNKTLGKIRILIPKSEIKDDYEQSFCDEKEQEQLHSPIVYKNPENISNQEYFDKRCKEKLREKFGDNLSNEIIERYEKEKDTIVSMGFCEIFLHYADVMDWAKGNNIMLGTGRGSAVGSLICYILGITNVNPLEYNLLFERFINKELITRPDIEIDVAESDKDKLTGYIFERFGSEYCAIDYEMSYPINFENNELALKTKIYACNKPLKECTPLGKLTDNIFYSLQPVSFFEQMGCLNFKFHSSKSLEKIKRSGINTDEIPLNSQAAFNLLKRNPKITSDIDDFEKIKPVNIEQIAHVLQLTRKSVINAGITDKYINAKNSGIVDYYSELLEPVLKETYGEIIWQEQIMQILNIIGGFSLNTADSIRRIMAKKTDAEKFLQIFIANAQAKGLEEERAKELWDKMYEVSSYCFMKSHAISFSLLFYYEAYIEIQECISTQNPLLTGFHELDNLINGLNNGELIVIAGRPSMGKSAYALNIALNVTKSREKTVAIFSLEMRKEVITKRLIACESNIEPRKLSSMNSPEIIEKCIHCFEDLSERKLLINDNVKNVKNIKEHCEILAKNGTKPDLIIIDYLQLMESDTEQLDRTMAISKITKDLKCLAKDLNIPVILLSQVSRSVEARIDKRPILSDLRTSSSIEEDADKVMFIYRNNYYNSKEDGQTEIIVAKNRTGNTGTAKLYFYKDFLKFVNQ